MKKKIILLVLFCSFSPISAQTNWFKQLFLPKILFDIDILKNFIRDDLPQADSFVLSQKIPNVKTAKDSAIFRDLLRMDIIFARAVDIENGDLETALFVSSAACLTHKNIPFTFGLKFPLTLENDSAYHHRLGNIPKNLFVDTPKEGDQDKFQHFFGSAYLSMSSDSWIAEQIGILIELGESGFVEGEDYDKRDVRANRLGQLYSKILSENPQTPPSYIFRRWNEWKSRK